MPAPIRKGSRSFEDWIEAFVSRTAFTSSPVIFRRWAAISCVASTLSRRTWVFTRGSPLYPNLYTIFVAAPGVGKTEMTNRVRLLLEGLDKEYAHVAPASITRAALADEIQDARIATPHGVIFNSLTLCINELGTFLPQYDLELVSALTDLYDCHNYTERKRTKNISIKIDDPQLNLLAATQPGFLTSSLPEIAWEQGFLSRCIIIYSAETVKQSLFDVPEEDTKTILEDLRAIALLEGRFNFTPEARTFIDEWHKADGPPKPEHPRLAYYNTRRTAHVLKLSQVASASRTHTMLISLSDVQRAIDWLVQAESEMEEIFKAIRSGGDSSIIRDAYHYLLTRYMKGGAKGKPIPASVLIAFLSERTDSYKVQHILNVMTTSGAIKGDQNNGYTPHIKRA